MNAVLHLAAVSRIHGEGATEVHALRDVTFRAHPGELVAVMGPSGSGKSTLLTLAGGLDAPTAGSVWIEGTDLASLDNAGRARIRRTSVGYVFQDFNLIPALTAAENVALPRELDGEKGKVARRLAMTALEEVGIADLADRFPDEMSGGQQQRSATMTALQDYTRLKRNGGDEDLAWSLVLDSLVFAAEAEIRWLDHCEARVRRAAAALVDEGVQRRSSSLVEEVSR